MCSPGITVFEGNAANPAVADFTFHFLASKKKLEGTFLGGKVIGTPYGEWKTPEERFDMISDWAMSVVGGCGKVCIEGYAFAAKGSALFQIGENTGVLKHKLYRAGIPYTTAAPTSVKKLACGNGRAKKGEMYDSFYDKTGINLCAALDVVKKDGNPISDIVDSYFICETLL